MPSAPRFPGLVLAAALCALGRAASLPEPVGPIVRLPEYAVKDTAIPPDPEPWHYAAIPGYEILAQTPDATTTKVAAGLVGFENIIRQIYPAIANTRLAPTRLILCNRRDTFERFVPASVTAEIPVAQVNRLFLGDEAHPVIVLYFGSNAAGNFYDVELARDYVANRLKTRYPPLPAWYVEGISRVFAAAEITTGGKHRTIQIGRLDDRAPTSPVAGGADGGPTEAIVIGATNPTGILTTDVARILQGDVLSAAFKEADAEGAPPPINPDVHLLGFRRYFFSGTRRPVPPLASLLAGPTASNYEDWSQGCGLFVHFCLCSRHKVTLHPAMERFFNHLPPAPDADPAPEFQEAFGKSFADVDKQMGYYVEQPFYTTTRYQFVPFVPAPVVLRDAADAESSAITAEAYAAAGYPALAGADLIASYRREKIANQGFEPRLLCALGIWESQHGRADRADLLLAAAAAMQYADPALYDAMAQRKLDQIDSSRPLTAAETAACLQPLATALAFSKWNPAVYQRMAEIWTRSAARPTPDDLATLAEGASTFPGDADLTYAMATAYLHVGQVAEARALALRETTNGDAATRAQFAALTIGAVPEPR